jgi:hypothetical protein
MNQNQINLYWREWGKCRAALRLLGFTPAEADAKRHELHIRALGADASHADLRNEDFDKILSVFRSYSQPDNLKEQLRIIDQHIDRLEAHRALAHKLCLECGVDEYGTERYLDALSRRINSRPFDRCNEIEVSKLCGVLTLQAKRAKRKAKQEANPF